MTRFSEGHLPPHRRMTEEAPAILPTSVLRAEGLVKRYRRRNVVDGVSLRVEQGRCVGLLGPNGAGKPTSLSMILAMVRPDRGRSFLDERAIPRMAMCRR